MPVLSYILTALGAYLLGSIPTGFLVAKAKGIDIRSVGSGNIGATNAMRVLGKPAGIYVMIVDCAKGFIACVLAAIYFDYCVPGPDYFDDAYWLLSRRLTLIAGIFAVLGHNYTCWLKFKGGKGIATTAGVYLALAPLTLGIAFAIFALALLATRYM